jgi:hypothetical protein
MIRIVLFIVFLFKGITTSLKAQSIIRHHIGACTSNMNVDDFYLVSSGGLTQSNHPTIVSSTPFVSFVSQSIEIGLIAFPNPASSSLSVVFEDGTDVIQVTIKDLFGKTCMYTDKSVFSVEFLPKGLYIIHASNHKGLNRSVKVNIL